MWDLEQQFQKAFFVPARHRWKSRRSLMHWLDAAGHDPLAGPLHSIVTTGGCAYVYARNDAYFTGVDDPATLRTRLQEWYDDMARGIDRFVPASADEAEDLATMRHFASEMWACAEVAWEIERVRWEAARR